MNLLAPMLLGQTASFSMTYPVVAAGNVYVFLWSSPPFGGVVPITVPGFTVNGLARVDLSNCIWAYSGVLDSSGTVIHSLAVPNNPTLVGVTGDLQSIDLAIASNTFSFADNDLLLFVAGPNILANMVPIAPGSFSMGSNAAVGVPYFSDPIERPVHQVTISQPFWIGKYEITQAEYLAVRGNNPSIFQGASWPNSANHPVEMVSWNDAMAYCVALTAQEALAGRLPTGYQYRLPTEAEWEYCCRAGTTTEFHYGSSLVCGQARFSYSWHSSSSCNTTSTVAVGSYAANAWGLHDMHGNVWEWCLDQMGVGTYPASLVVDPYSNSGPNRVVRGGAWDFQSYLCRSAYRSRILPTPMRNDLGFRVVLAPVLF